MAKKIIAGNWKLNPTSLKEASTIFDGVKKKTSKLKNVTTIICPPAPYLAFLAKKGLSTNFQLGAQDAHWEESGAFTGEVSSLSVSELGANYVILGHSEKRAAGDTDEIVNKKVKTALKNGLKVILCVGEKERDEKGAYIQVLQEQLSKSLAGVNKKFAEQVIIAYEPVWAIGKNATGVETPEGFQHNSLVVKKALSKILGKDNALKTPVLYGGSVSAKNAESFLKEGQADGLLVGRESLTPVNFAEIVAIASKI